MQHPFASLRVRILSVAVLPLQPLQPIPNPIANPIPKALRILSVAVLPPQPLQLELRAGGWGAEYGAAEVVGVRVRVAVRIRLGRGVRRRRGGWG